MAKARLNSPCLQPSHPPEGVVLPHRPVPHGRAGTVNRPRRRASILLFAVISAGCGNPDDSDARPACVDVDVDNCKLAYAPEYPILFDRIFLPKCASAGGACHGGVGQGGLAFVDANASYDLLLTAKQDGARVKAGNARCSELVVRLRFNRAFMVNASGRSAGRRGSVLHSPLGPDGRDANAVSSTRAARPHHADVGHAAREGRQCAHNVLRAGLFMAILPAFGCGSSSPTEPAEDPAVRREKLLDPETCKECHLQHFQEWSASMHAYASADPVFVAMNRRGQEETGGKLGSFCVNCHAPMAVQEGKTVDGLNLEDLPPKLRGITCYFCHNAAAVEGTHNNPIVLANDDVMRGSFIDPPPVKSPAHASQYSPFMLGIIRAERTSSAERATTSSSTPPQHIRRSAMVRSSSSARTASGKTRSLPSARVTIGPACAAHHMPNPPPPFKKEGPAAESTRHPVVSRNLHEHMFPGVDVAITRFPDTGNFDEDTRLEAHHRKRVQDLLDSTLQVNELCVSAVGDRSRVSVSLENVTAGHAWPSGASHDRRAWVEVKAYLDGQPTPVYQSGVVAEGEDVTALAASDPDLWLIKDELTGVVAGKEPHMFWDIIDSKPGTLPARVTNDPSKPDSYNNHRAREFPRRTSLNHSRTRRSRAAQGHGAGTPAAHGVRRARRPHRIGAPRSRFRAKMPIFNVLPNVNYAKRLPQFREVSFEWSDAVLRSGIYLTARRTEAGVVKECVGQITQR